MRNKFGNKKIIFITFFCIFIGFFAFILYPLPKVDPILINYPENYYIEKLNRFEEQPPNQCAGYTTAYILRNFNIEVNGTQVYDEISYKIPIYGYVLPKGIISYLESHGLSSKVFRGTLGTLKTRLTKGEPIITLIGQGIKWQHYMTLVGYDDKKQELYFYDSKKKVDENGKYPGNRTLNENYFLVLWNNGLPAFNHVYIQIEK